MDYNRKAWTDAKNHRDWVDSEIRNALDFIGWAN